MILPYRSFGVLYVARCYTCRAAEALIACLPMVEITKKNSKFVEGVVCQIIEPDLQQTASYFRRMREKGPERVASSLGKHQVRNFCVPILQCRAKYPRGLPAPMPQCEVPCQFARCEHFRSRRCMDPLQGYADHQFFNYEFFLIVLSSGVASSSLSAVLSRRSVQEGLEKRAERMWNCINALSSAADGSDGLADKTASATTQPRRSSMDASTLPPMPSLSSVQSSARNVGRSKSQNDAGSHAVPFRPGSVPLSSNPQPSTPHFPPKAPASFRPPRSLRPLHTPHAYASHIHAFHPSSPMAAFSHSSGTPAAMSSQLPFSPSPHPTGFFAPPQCTSPAFCSAPLPGTAVAEPPMAAFLQSAADAARRFRKSNSLTPRHSTLRPRSSSPSKPTLTTAPTAFPEIFSPGSSHSSSAKLPISAAAQGPLPDLDNTIRAALSAQEELSAELDRHDAMAAASAAAPGRTDDGSLEEEFEAQMQASASVIEAASREIDDADAAATFGKTLRAAASAQDEMSRELDNNEAKRAWEATVRAAASAQDELSHELELRSSTAAGGGTSSSIGDAFGELERQVEEVSREMKSMPGVGRTCSGSSSALGKPPRSGSMRRDSRETGWERRATLGIEEVDDFADEAGDVLAEEGLEM